MHFSLQLSFTVTTFIFIFISPGLRGKPSSHRDQAPGLLSMQHLSERQHHRDQSAAAEREAPLPPPPPPHSMPLSSVMLGLLQQHTPHGPKHLSASDTLHQEAQLNRHCCVTSPRRMFNPLPIKAKEMQKSAVMKFKKVKLAENC